MYASSGMETHGERASAPETASLTCASPPRPTVQVQHAVPVEDFDRMLSLLGGICEIAL
jgi:hypothetical protein